MKIIEVESCKDCPYKNMSYSFASGKWELSCQKDAIKVSDYKFISESKFIKDKIKYDIPNWCELKEIV